jgi:hypothetical protein
MHFFFGLFRFKQVPFRHRLLFIPGLDHFKYFIYTLIHSCIAPYGRVEDLDEIMLVHIIRQYIFPRNIHKPIQL